MDPSPPPPSPSPSPSPALAIASTPPHAASPNQPTNQILSSPQHQIRLGFCSANTTSSGIIQVKKSVRFSLVEADSETIPFTKSLASASDFESPHLQVGFSSNSKSKKKVEFEESAAEEEEEEEGSASDFESPHLQVGASSNPKSKKKVEFEELAAEEDEEGSSSNSLMQRKCLEILSSKHGTPAPRSFIHGAELALDPSLRARFLGSRCGTPKRPGNTIDLQKSDELQDSTDRQEVSWEQLPANSTSHSGASSSQNSSGSGDPVWKRRQPSKTITGLEVEADESELLESFDLHI